MNIKALFLALSRVNAFIIFGRRVSEKSDQTGFNNVAVREQREFISRSDQGSTTWPYASNASSFQDKAWVQQRGRSKSKKAT